jgi:hypothetical protein
MGKFAIVEDQQSGEQKLLKEGDSWGNYRIKTIASDKLICVSPQGAETILQRHAGEAVEVAQDFPLVAGRPYQELLQRDLAMRHLQQTCTALHYHNASLRDVVNDLAKKAQCDIVFAPEVYLTKTFDELPPVTLSTGEISLYKAVSLVAAYGDMYCVQDKDRLMLALAGTRQDDPLAKYLRGLARARCKVMESGRIRTSFMDKNITLPGGRQSLGRLVAIMQSGGIELIVGSEIVERNPPYFSARNQTSVTDLLEQLAQNAQGDYAVVDGVWYLVGMGK